LQSPDLSIRILLNSGRGSFNKIPQALQNYGEKTQRSYFCSRTLIVLRITAANTFSILCNHRNSFHLHARRCSNSKVGGRCWKYVYVIFLKLNIVSNISSNSVFRPSTRGLVILSIELRSGRNSTALNARSGFDP